MSHSFSLKFLILGVALLRHPLTEAAPAALSQRADAAPVSVVVNGKTYVNKGLVGFGLIPSDAKESTGDTIGGIGSAIAIRPGSWKQSLDGSYQGTFIVHPDRGFNVDGTIDYQARQFTIDFVFKPYYGTNNLPFETAQQTLNLTYKSTVLQVDSQGVKTTGLDPLHVRAAQSGFPVEPFSQPPLPIPSDDHNQVSIDAEGIVANPDGTFWVSDEYGPYIYKFSADGKLLQTIQPPDSILPKDEDGNIIFSGDEDPETGRAANKGLESLTIDQKTGTLYAMLQSATIQDGGDDKKTSRFTRLIAFNVSDPYARPALVGEYVVPLPQSSKGNTLEANELHFVSPGIFLVLSRDGDGRSGDDTKSKYKQVDLIDISKATDIHGTKFDDPSNPIANKGTLDSSITPATYTSFLNFIDDDQLAKVGLHNDDPDDRQLIAAKWESLALAPVGESAYPNDFFLFIGADNDFISTHGVALGQPFDAGLDLDNQFLVFRVTLPGLTKEDVGV